MLFSRLFFRVITSWPAMMLGHLVILGMVIFVLYTDSAPLASCIVANLRNETISTIVIAWGVLLESRHELVSSAATSVEHVAESKDYLSDESKSAGLLLVCLGLFLEILTYFDASIHLHPTPSWVSSLLHGAVWVILVAVCMRLFISCVALARLRRVGACA